MNTFLFDPEASFTDLTDTVAKTAQMDPYYQQSRGISAYFPFAYLLAAVARHWSQELLVKCYLYFSLGSGLVLSGLAAMRTDLIRRHAFVLGLLLFVLSAASYPVLFALDRGNLDTIIAALCFLSVLLLLKDRPWLAAFALAPAIALKGYPLLFCALFATQQRWRAALGAMAAAGALTLVALLSLSGGLYHNLYGFARGLHNFNAAYVKGIGSMHYSADAYNGLRILRIWKPDFMPGLVAALLTYYKAFSYSAVAFCLAYAVLAKAPFHRRFLAVTLGMVLFPDVINDYKLVHFIPALYFLATAEEPWTWLERSAYGAILLLLIPKHYYFLFSDCSLSSLISPLLLAVMLGGLLLDRQAWRSPIGLAV